VAVRIEKERSVVARAVVRPYARCPVVASAGGQPLRVEAIHGRPVGGTKSDVGADGGGALIRVEPQTRLARRAEAGVTVAAGVELGTERSQRAAVEADTGLEVPDLQADMVEHRDLL